MLVKRPFYAEAGVQHLWYIDPEAKTLTVSRLEGGGWLELAVVGGDRIVRVEPFDALGISLDAWWAGVASEE